jgi:hypothetical protein
MAAERGLPAAYNARVTKVAGLAFALSAVALGVAVVALTREAPEPRRAPQRSDRVEALEAEVAELRREVEVLKTARPDGAAAPAPPVLPSPGDAGTAPDPSSGVLESLVDEAVAKKTERVLDEMRVKENKKPAIDAFASVLELTDEQRSMTERVVVQGQREVHAILNTQTYDGTNLLDQLVEIAAKGIAQPGKDHGWGLWLARVLTEKVPGTDETYGARIESVKGRMRGAFKREWTEAQYKEFETWGVDPTEIAQVPGSPNDDLVKRVTDRARALGAVLPND